MLLSARSITIHFVLSQGTKFLVLNGQSNFHVSSKILFWPGGSGVTRPTHHQAAALQQPVVYG